jgi:hypothetical protein
MLKSRSECSLSTTLLPGNALAAKLFDAQSTLEANPDLMGAVAVQEMLISASLQGEGAVAAAAAAGLLGVVRPARYCYCSPSHRHAF